MKLPETFIRRMEKRLGTDLPAFLHAMDEPSVRGMRANTLKIAPEDLVRFAPAGARVPWTEDGFYTQAEHVGGLPAHHAGLFYSQEPSAMCAAPLLQVRPGERVLDLCAAPGGKTGQLAAAMRGEGVLIANEYVYGRARILSQNVERLGIANCAAVCADPAALAARFPEYFDKILVDAPCSGEGMFRRDETALQEWSEENVARCIVRQAGILDAAAAMLRGGGRMVYSTCTFEEDENEGQIAAFLARHPEFSCAGTRLLLPHEVCGEGHFAAVLEKRSGGRGEAPPFPVRRDGAAERAFRAFAEEFFVRQPQGAVTVTGEGRVYLLPSGMPAAGVRTLRVGIEAGCFDGKRFIPAHALAVQTAFAVGRAAPLTDEDCTRYLRGETIACGIPDGWCAAVWRGHALGLGKVVDGVMKNHYPKGLRER